MSIKVWNLHSINNFPTKVGIVSKIFWRQQECLLIFSVITWRSVFVCKSFQQLVIAGSFTTIRLSGMAFYFYIYFYSFIKTFHTLTFCLFETGISSKASWTDRLISMVSAEKSSWSCPLWRYIFCLKWQILRVLFVFLSSPGKCYEAFSVSKAYLIDTKKFRRVQ